MRTLCAIVFSAMALSASGVAEAAALPGSADAGRIDQREELQMLEVKPPLPPKSMRNMPAANAPKGSESRKVKLKDIRITGMSVYKTNDIKDIYAPYIGREVTLDSVWVIAGKLSERYHSAGYFLSRALVPQQEIKDGIVVLRVVEGYIGEVKFDDPLAKNFVVKKWINKLLAYRPLKADQIESILLRLNDLPGVDLQSVLEPMKTVEKNEGAVRLVLKRKDIPKITARVTFDNFGSRFLGPYEAQAQAELIFWPTQKTTVSFLSSLPWKKMKYGSIKHEMPIYPGGTLEVYGSYTSAAPGDTLEQWGVASSSSKFGAAVTDSLIRQRRENLSGRFALEMHNTETDILGALLTKDNIRAVRFNLNYELADDWNGNNMLDATASQGLDFLGGSNEGDRNLSRAGAAPDFTKLNLSAARLQGIDDDWSIYAALSGQVSAGSLYASEQFGYGGQSFGRAYDDSEITGDEGIDFSAEVRYAGFGPWYGFQPIPYQFYDIGAVWNDGQGATLYASGSSAGAGVRILSEYGVSGNLGLAFPLTRRVQNPLYGNGKSPRYYMQGAYAF